MLFFTTEQIGPKRQRTPEGFLLCLDVPIARIGEQLYGPGETPIDPGPDGAVHIQRNPEEVFRPETIASFNGKPITDDHPDREKYPDGVTPANWRELSHGHATNIRRGEGDQDSLLLADLLIQDHRLIGEVDAGKRQVSCGYDTNWFKTGPGQGEQRDIVGNHIALVTAARCGSICSIGDRQPIQSTKETCVKKPKWKQVADAVRAAFKAKDETKMEEALAEGEKAGDEEPEGGLHIHTGTSEGRIGDMETQLKAHENKLVAHDGMHAQHTAKDAEFEGRLAKLEGKESGEDAEGMKEIEAGFEEEAPAGTGDKARKAADSVYMGDSFQNTLALAEIISPGIRVPVYDQKAKPRVTYDALCDLRRRALLQGAASDMFTQSIILGVRAGKALDNAGIAAMKCGAVRDLFLAVGTAKKAANMGKTAGGAVGDARSHIQDALRDMGDTSGPVGKAKSIAEVNKENRNRYKVQ